MSRVTIEPGFTYPPLPSSDLLIDLVRLLARDAARADFSSQTNREGQEQSNG